MGIHASLASVTNIPEIELTETEGKNLAKAVQNVMQYYPVAIDPKTQAWMGLIMTASSMYGMRAIAYYARTSTESKTPEQPPAHSGLRVAQ